MSRARDIADGKFSGDLEADSPTFVVDAASNNVGIGTSSPATKLHVDGQLSVQGGDASIQTRGGNEWLMISSNQGYNTSGMHLKLDRTSGGRAMFITNTTERMRIDEAGRVTMPYQPAFHAAGTGQLIPSDGQVMPFSTAVTNRGSHYNTSTYRFTAPVSGVYLLAARATWSASGSGPVPHIAINGAAVGGSATYTQIFGYTSSGAYHTTSAVAAPVSMNAGDYADVRVSIFNSSAGQFDLTRCSFSGYLIG